MFLQPLPLFPPSQPYDLYSPLAEEPNPERSVEEVDNAITSIVGEINLSECNFIYEQTKSVSEPSKLSPPPLEDWTTDLNDECKLMGELDELAYTCELGYPTSYESPKESAALLPEHSEECSTLKEEKEIHEVTKKRKREESVSDIQPVSIVRKRSISSRRRQKNLSHCGQKQSREKEIETTRKRKREIPASDTQNVSIKKGRKPGPDWDEASCLKMIELAFIRRKNGRTDWKRVGKELGNNKTVTQLSEKYRYLFRSRKKNRLIVAQFNKFPKLESGWNEANNLKLIELVFIHKKNSQTDWKRVAENLRNDRTPEQCKAQYLRLDKARETNPAIDAQFNKFPRSTSNFNEPKWQISEWGPSNNRKLIKLAFKYMKNGRKDWIKVTEMMKMNKTRRDYSKQFDNLCTLKNPVIRELLKKYKKKFS